MTTGIERELNAMGYPVLYRDLASCRTLVKTAYGQDHVNDEDVVRGLEQVVAAVGPPPAPFIPGMPHVPVKVVGNAFVVDVDAPRMDWPAL